MGDRTDMLFDALSGGPERRRRARMSPMRRGLLNLRDTLFWLVPLLLVLGMLGAGMWQTYKWVRGPAVELPQAQAAPPGGAVPAAASPAPTGRLRGSTGG